MRLSYLSVGCITLVLIMLAVPALAAETATGATVLIAQPLAFLICRAAQTAGYSSAIVEFHLIALTAAAMKIS